MHSQLRGQTSISSNGVHRLVEEALDCVGNERLMLNVGTTAVMVAPSELVIGLVCWKIMAKVLFFFFFAPLDGVNICDQAYHS